MMFFIIRVCHPFYELQLPGVVFAIPYDFLGNMSLGLGLATSGLTDNQRLAMGLG